MTARLLVVTPSPPGSVGGTQTLVRVLARSLADDFGVEVTVATAEERDAAAASGRPWREVGLSPAVRPLAAGLPAARHLIGDVWFPDLSRLVDAVRPHAILSTPHNSPCAHETARVASDRGLPLLLLPLVHLDLRRHVNSSARRLYRSAALVIAVSEVERRWLLGRARIPPEKILRLHYGQGDGLPPHVDPLRGGDPERPLRLLTVGGYRSHKRVADQIEALAILRRSTGREFHLTVVGSREPGSVLGRLEALARRRGLERHMSLIEDCSDREIAQSLRHSGVFLFTSASESLGVALFEAIAEGTFPVVYPHPVYRELVESSGFGAVARKATPGALAEAVLAAPADPPLPMEERRKAWLAERSAKRMAEPLAERLAWWTSKPGAAISA